MSTGNLAPAIRQQWLNGGLPLSGGQLFSYLAGTTTPQNTYTDQTIATPNTNPVILDTNGQANVWLDPTLSYKFVLQDALNNVLWTVDNIVGLLGNDSIPTAAIQDGAVTAAKLADNAVTSAILASDPSIDTNRAVETDHIRDQQVTAGKLAQSGISMAGFCNIGLTTSVASNAMTVTLTDGFGATPSVGSPGSILFRNQLLLNTGYPTFGQVTAATSLVIPSGASLGSFLVSINKDIWVYALNNSGTVELAVSGSRIFDETVLQSTTAITSGSTNNNVLYSTAARTTVPVRLIGRLVSDQATPGTYLAAATGASLYSPDIFRQQSEFFGAGAGTYGSTNTMFRYFAFLASALTGGYDISYFTDPADGDRWVINTPDFYSINYWDNFSGGSQFAITKNDTGGTTSISSISPAVILATASTSAANQIGSLSVRTFLNANDVIRAHTQGTSNGTSSNGSGFRIIRG